MKILAITLEKCSGCAIFVDDEIIFSSSEERYTRIKSDSSFPKNSNKIIKSPHEKLVWEKTKKGMHFFGGEFENKKKH